MPSNWKGVGFSRLRKLTGINGSQVLNQSMESLFIDLSSAVMPFGFMIGIETLVGIWLILMEVSFLRPG
jgi:hypothetical protein